MAKFAAANQAPFAVMELSTGREFSLNPPVTFKGAALVDTPFVITAADAYRQFSPLEQFTNMEHLKQIITGKFDWPFCAGEYVYLTLPLLNLTFTLVVLSWD